MQEKLTSHDHLLFAVTLESALEPRHWQVSSKSLVPLAIPGAGRILDAFFIVSIYAKHFF
jgi:hypothetical protein